MQVVYAGEEIPEIINKSIFLAGPTPRKPNGESWRPDALRILEEQSYNGVVFIPEPRNKQWLPYYEEQISWEEKCLNVADCIVFWVPRDTTVDNLWKCVLDRILCMFSKNRECTVKLKMPAFTTNIEFGAWCNSGKIVLGAPNFESKSHNKYLKYYADKGLSPTAISLSDTLKNALSIVGEGAIRKGGERFVPLQVWKKDSFQKWYSSQVQAGNSLQHAKVLYTYRPEGTTFVFLWILKVSVYISAEKRFKTNEFVIGRTDISSILLWRRDSVLENSEVVLVKEFRSPARTKDGCIWELTGGSSISNRGMTETAVEEIKEELGLVIDPSRLKFFQERQVFGTLLSHTSSLFTVEITEEEMEYLKSQKGIPHGNEADTERTYIEIVKFKDLLNSSLDWSNIGYVYSLYYKEKNI